MFKLLLIRKDYGLGHHVFSVNLDDNFHSILSNGEKEYGIFNALVCMRRNLIIARSFMRKLYKHKEEFQDIDTNKKINILDFNTFLNFYLFIYKKSIVTINKEI